VLSEKVVDSLRHAGGSSWAKMPVDISERKIQYYTRTADRDRRHFLAGDAWDGEWCAFREDFSPAGDKQLKGLALRPPQRKDPLMLFSAALELLKDTGNGALVLSARRASGAVLVAPDLVGRVLCSTFNRVSGAANGWINEAAVRRGKADPVFNNFGGEERIWFAPEGGPFGLMFGRKESKFENYCVQPGMSTAQYKVAEESSSSVLLEADLTLENAVGTRFAIHVERQISVIESCPYAIGVRGRMEVVGFQTENTVTNTGEEWERSGGTVAIWCLGQFLEHPRLSIIVPVNPVADSESSPATVDEYFKDFCIGGVFPSNRRVDHGDFVVLKADGRIRGKVGIKRGRATGRLGSYNPDDTHLTFVDHDFHPELEYASGYWRRYENAFDGDALSVYIDGPERPGGSQGVSYELETMSPALFLEPNQSFAYRNRTFHLRGDRGSLDLVCRRSLGPTLDQLEEFARSTD